MKIATHIKKFFGNKKLVFKTVTLCAAAFVFLAAIFLLWVSSWRIPTLDSFEGRSVTESTKIYDRTGEILLYDVYQNIKRTVVPFDDISPNIKEAILAIEDNTFYQHHGIKITSIIRAVFANLTGLGYNQGGSTITQQVVKNSLLTGEKKISRKIKEWVLAPKIEKILTKDEILSIYLNEIPFGGSLYGVEEASLAFFGKKSKDVTLAEAAYLAALPQAPTYYSPYGQHKDALDDRKNLVLKEMLENKFITQEEYGKAKQEKVTFRPQEAFGIKAPHFVLYVKEELEKKYGERVLEEGGLKVITTLDYDLQKFAEDEALKQALENKKNFNAENIGLVAVNPKNGDILSMVGSRNYFDKEIQGNFNITTSKRQPGSAFKPFAYAEAFLKGYTPDTVLFDVPTEFSTSCPIDGSSDAPECYTPENYDLKYRGPITMREALAQSINIPAIKTLYLAGMRDTLRLAKDMGISTLTDINQYGLTLVLGGGEVSLLDLTSSYGVFANDGVRNPARAILEVRDRNGNVIDKAKETPTRVLDEQVAQEISDILSDEQARAPAFGYNSPLHFPGRDVAVKTGTTNDYRDAIIAGYTPDIAIAAWAGNNSNAPMERKIAAFIIAPYWNKIMNQALKKVPDTKFLRPPADLSYNLKPVLRGKWQGGISEYDSRSFNNLVSDLDSSSRTERLTGGVHSILYWVDKDDPRGPVPSRPQNDPQFEAWEYGVQKWAQANGYDRITNYQNDSRDTQTNNSNSDFEINISTPSNRTYDRDKRVNVEFRGTGPYNMTKADYYVNDAYIGSAYPPFTFSFTPMNVPSIQSGSNMLQVIVYDAVLNTAEDTVRFNVRD